MYVHTMSPFLLLRSTRSPLRGDSTRLLKCLTSRHWTARVSRARLLNHPQMKVVLRIGEIQKHRFLATSEGKCILLWRPRPAVLYSNNAQLEIIQAADSDDDSSYCSYNDLHLFLKTLSELLDSQATKSTAFPFDVCIALLVMWC